MTAPEIKISRDRENDVLYVIKNFVDTKKVSNLVVNADFTMRLIKETKEVVGFTIDEFSKFCPEWVEKSDYELMEKFDEILDVVNDNCQRRLTHFASEAVTS